MNNQLIADAVGKGSSDDDTTVWDRLYAFWFRRLVYTQIWEDPVADLAALRLPLGSTIVTIASGGWGFVPFRTMRISGNFSARPTPPPIPSFIARGCGHGWIRRHAPIGTSATSSAARAILILPTASTGMACLAASSALLMLPRNCAGLIL